MKRTISFNRYRYYLLATAACLFGTFIYHLLDDQSRDHITTHSPWYVWLVPLMAMILAWQALSLAAVAIDDQNLYVSRRGKLRVIPITQIHSVTGGRHTLESVCITFNEATGEGDKLFFYPRSDGFRAKGFHDDVEKLKSFANINAERHQIAQQDAPPNGGPSTPTGRSDVDVGPPSVS